MSKSEQARPAPKAASDLCQPAPDEIVSSVVVDGVMRPISFYKDSKWLFIEGATNLGRNSRFIDFDLIPTEFCDRFKAIMFTYWRNGRRSRARPTIATTRMHYFTAREFFVSLQEDGVRHLEDATSQVCLAYVEKLKSRRTRYGKPLSALSIEKKLLTVELLHEVGTELGYAIPHPWPNTNAAALADSPRWTGARIPKTPLIPDAILAKIYQEATKIVHDANRILDFRDALDEERKRHPGRDVRYKFLRTSGWVGSLFDLKHAVKDIRSACYIIVATLTGCRNHEIAHIKLGSYHRTLGDDGEEYWWITSVSTKTQSGRCRWMVPFAAVEALRVMERWAAPLHEEVRRDIARLRSRDPADPEIAEAQRQEDALFIGKSDRGITTLSASTWCDILKEFILRRGVEWPLATHQFRRTFAVYAAKSQLGDLRYLKEHFKHWSMDMTLLYAMGGLQERELLDEIRSELDLLRDSVVEAWLQPTAKLAGGGGRRVMSFRDLNPIPIYKTRKEMVEAISLGVHLRSNGHAWCTADNGTACLGNSGVDPTRCTECTNAVIAAGHADYYRQLRDDLRALLDQEDIGESGRSRVARDLARCDEVLRRLGVEV